MGFVVHVFDFLKSSYKLNKNVSKILRGYIMKKEIQKITILKINKKQKNRTLKFG